MQYELAADGRAVYFVSVNKADAVDTQGKLVERATYPLLQDTAAVGAWALHDGKKDDFLIYDAQGHLVTYLPFGGEVDTNLSTAEGYANVKNALLAALEAGK